MKSEEPYKSCWAKSFTQEPSIAEYERVGGHIYNQDDREQHMHTNNERIDIAVKMCHMGAQLVTSCPHRR